MKKALAVLGFLVASVSAANASVLCTIITKDPRYNVASYVRSQTACKTTSFASTIPLPKMVLLAAGVYVVGQLLNNIPTGHAEIVVAETNNIREERADLTSQIKDEVVGPKIDYTRAQYQPAERTECFYTRTIQGIENIQSCINHFLELDKFCSDNPQVDNNICYKKGSYRKEDLKRLESKKEDLLLTAAYGHLSLKEQSRHRDCHEFLKIAQSVNTEDSKKYWTNRFNSDCQGVVLKML